MLIEKLEQNIERLLREAISYSDLKLLNRWLKILCSLLSKEFKSGNIDNINKLYGIIIDLTENLISLLESDDGEESLYLGPSIFEVLVKVKSSIEEYENYLEKLKDSKDEEPQIKLSPEQIESLERIKNLF
jgi:hypothetical protein